MQLTLFSDYSLRLLMYLGLTDRDLTPVDEVSTAYGVSRHYMLKVAKELTRLGYVEAVRGRRGGVRLSARPDRVTLGEVVRQTEPPGGVLECVGDDHADCAIVGACRLRLIFGEAQAAFYGVLDRYTLADLLEQPRALSKLLQLPPPA